jgi:hypothetical protein
VPLGTELVPPTLAPPVLLATKLVPPVPFAVDVAPPAARPPEPLPLPPELEPPLFEFPQPASSVTTTAQTSPPCNRWRPQLFDNFGLSFPSW